MPHSAATDLGLHGMSMSHKKDARLKWVKSHAFGPDNGTNLIDPSKHVL